MANSNVVIKFEDEVSEELRALTNALLRVEHMQYAISTVDLHPSDIIVISAPNGLTQADQEPIRRMFPDNRVVILEHGATLEVIRQ